MSLEFLDYIEGLSAFIIPDLSNIIISYISHYTEIFNENFIFECIETGDYLYYNKNNTTLLHYLFQKKRLYNIKDLLKNSNHLKATHLQNEDKNGRTELYQLCYNSMYYTIGLIKDLKPKHFQNINKKGETELYWLCYNKMHKTIALITSNFVNGDNKGKVFGNVQSTFWKPEHFQNKDEDGFTELYWLCNNGMHQTITLITSNFNDGGNGLRTFWKPEHFQNKDKDGRTELCCLCQNKMHSIIASIKDLKAAHFQNKSEDGKTELYWLCQKKMHSTIVIIKDLKAKHFQNKDKNGRTELSLLCYKKMHSTIALIKDLKAEHFQNKDMHEQTELYWLCYREMHLTIALITSNFVGGANEDKVFDNVQSTFWKPEHFIYVIEREYMGKYNFI